jgi:hypothetical protein
MSRECALRVARSAWLVNLSIALLRKSEGTIVAGDNHRGACEKNEVEMLQCQGSTLITPISLMLG